MFNLVYVDILERQCTPRLTDFGKEVTRNWTKLKAKEWANERKEVSPRALSYLWVHDFSHAYEWVNKAIRWNEPDSLAYCIHSYALGDQAEEVIRAALAEK